MADVSEAAAPAAAVETVADAPAAATAEEVSLTPEQTEQLNKQVRKQMEFYFSDSNFPTDKFLRGTAARDPDGWVPLATLLTFKRMKTIFASVAGVPDDAAAQAGLVADAIEGSDVVEADEEKQRVRRVHPLPEEDKSMQRSIYLKGFPTDTELPALESWAEQTFGLVRAVRMRRVHGAERDFKGSVFVELEDDAAVDAAIEKKPEFKDKKLIIMKKSAYIEKKRAEVQARRAKRDAKRGKTKPAGDGSGSADAAPAEPEPLQYDKGLILKFSGVGEGCTREDLKMAFGAYGGAVAYADFSRGQVDGYLRFGAADVAAAAAKGVVENKVELAGAVPTVSILEGDEEEEYWKQMTDRKAAAVERRGSQGRRGGRGGGRRGGGGGGYKGVKRSRDDADAGGDGAADEATSPKKAKTE